MNIPNYPLSTIPYASPASSGVLNDIISEIDQNFDTLKTDAETECQSIRDDTAADRQAIRDETAADRQAIRNEMEADFNTIHLQQVPIGSIIGLHPNVDVSKVIDTDYWIYCDGAGTFRFTYADGTQSTDIDVPNLTDSRFLMGGTEFGTGGDNFLTDHTHGCSPVNDGHTHSHNHPSRGSSSDSHAHNMYAGNRLYYNSVGAVSGSGITGILRTSGNSFYSNSVVHSHSTDLPSATSGGPDRSHSHVIGENQPPSATSNLPQYFKVKYYIRIK